MTRGSFSFVLGAASALLFAGVAAAETTSCTVLTSFPATISAPGIYCLDADGTFAASTGHAIEITASDVVLDLNGHALSGNADPAADNDGVFSDGPRNVTVKNGTITGFARGVALGRIFFQPPDGHVVEDLRVVDSKVAGIIVNGNRHVVRHNVVLRVGGSTLSPNQNVVGIASFGSSNRILDNDVDAVRRVGTGEASGIHFLRGGDNLAVENRITRARFGIKFEPQGPAGARGKYRDNLTSGVAVPYLNGTDSGGND